MTSVNIREILDKMDNSDSDYRFMAVSDLLTALSSNTIKVDVDTQKKLSRAIVKLLKDSNSEVQGMAMRCLPHLAITVDVPNSVYIVGKLLDNVLEAHKSKSRQTMETIGLKAIRDISSISLKSIIGELESGTDKTTQVGKHIVSQLVKDTVDIELNGDPAEVLVDIFEILHEILLRAGAQLTSMHKSIADRLFAQSLSKNSLVRKRVVTCTGALGSSCDDSLFNTIVKKVLQDLQSNDYVAVRTGVQAIWSLSKSSGHRLGPHLRTIVPILLNYATKDHEADNNDLKEQCLQALESFCLRCKSEMIEFMPLLIQCVKEMAKYDPNYVNEEEDDINNDDDGDQDEDENEEDEEEDDDEMYGDMDEDYSDDDDTSWKVRRAAIRCIHAAISAKLLSINDLCTEFGIYLALRFKEREETVKLDVFEAFIALINLARTMYENGLISSESSDKPVDNAKVDTDQVPNSSLTPILSRGTHIIRRIKNEMGSKSSNVKIRCMSLIAEFIRAIPSLAPQLIDQVITPVLQNLLDGGTPMKMEAVSCLRSMVEIKYGYPLREIIERVIINLLTAAKSMYYKVTADCLTLCGDALSIFGKAPEDVRSRISTTIEAVHEEVLERATDQDQDSEVKQASIRCLGELVCYFGNLLDEKRVARTQAALFDRLGNDVTRIATVRAMYTIAVSSNATVVVPVMQRSSAELCGFLRKSNLNLRTTTLELLSEAPLLPSENDATLVSNLSDLLSENDLGLSSLSLRLFAKMLRDRGSEIVGRIGSVSSAYSKALHLATSPLFQGKTAEALYEFFMNIAKLDTNPLTSQKMIGDLREKASGITYNPTASGARNSPIQSVAKCVVAVCEGSSTDISDQIKSEIIKNVTSSEVRVRNFSLVCLGQLGNHGLLSERSGEYQGAHEAILQSLNHEVEDIRTAAAIALGGLASANSCGGISELISLLKHGPSQRYLILLALKETITCGEKDAIVPYISKLLPVLLDGQSNSYNGVNEKSRGQDGKDGSFPEEESLRSATAECLSLLLRIAPRDVIISLAEASSSPASTVRASVAASIKFAATSGSDGNEDILSHLKSSMKAMTSLIGDDDVSVAKNAVQAVNAVARSCPSILSPQFVKILEEIYSRTAKDKSLVRIVDLGPFKHEEDYGLDLRKSAFDCIRTFISGPLIDLVSLPTLMQYLAPGLKDQADVRSIAQLTLALVSTTSDAGQIVQSIKPVIAALESTLRERVKENAVRQEAERHEDSVRGALRAIRMMEKVPTISSNRDFQNFMDSIVRTSKFIEKYEAISQNEEDLVTVGNRANVISGGNRSEISYGESKRKEDVIMLG